MSEIIERGAAAIFESSDDWNWNQSGAYAEQDETTKEIFRAAARALLKAIREPTPEMEAAVSGWWADASPLTVWQAMIDAALNS